MKGYITTLPITPRVNPGIKLLIQPFIMDVLGSKLGLNKIISLGVNGLNPNGLDSVISGYLDSNKQLGINPDLVWQDNLKKDLPLIRKLTLELISSGHITQEKAKIVKCPCGVVESLFEADNVSLVRKKYRDGKCLICGQNLKISTDKAYLFHFPSAVHNLPMRIFPKFYEKEIRNMANKFSGYKFLISRSRPSAFSFNNDISLDVDFVWQLFLSVLCRNNRQVEVLVGSNLNLMACLFIIIFLRLIDERGIDIIIPPLYLATNRKKLNSRKYSLSSLLSKHSPITIRLALAAAMNWNKKETVVDFEFMELIQKMSYRIKGLPHESLNIEDISLIFNKQSIRQLLSEAKKTRETYSSEELYGII